MTAGLFKVVFVSVSPRLAANKNPFMAQKGRRSPTPVKSALGGKADVKDAVSDFR